MWPLLFLLPENGAVIDRAFLVSLTSLSHVPALDVLGERSPTWEVGLRRCVLELAYMASKESIVCIFSTPHSGHAGSLTLAMVEYVEIGTLQTRAPPHQEPLAY